MPDLPPWEWVEGDVVRSTRYALIMGVVLGAVALLLVFVVLNGLFLAGMLAASPVPIWLLTVLNWCVLVPVFALLILFNPGRVPIVGRLGISPAGLRLVFPLFKVTVRWGAVRWVGPDWVEVSLGRWGSQRYRLTSDQIQRLARFTQPG
jgi:hypothetical protein